MNLLPIPLYHGTSTIFLDSIIEKGLGSINPLEEWGVYALSKEVLELTKEHLQHTNLYKRSLFSFQKMVEQDSSGRFNFQHGDTYVSPALSTAANYAINKRYGSEMLTYTIDFLKELLSLDIPYVKQVLYRKYGKVFGLIEAPPSPILIEISSISKLSLTSEHGENPDENFQQIEEILSSELKENYQVVLQQCNFRLKETISKDRLKISMINVQKWNQLNHQYNLYSLNI